MHHVEKCSKTTEQQNESKPAAQPTVQVLSLDKAPQGPGLCSLCTLLSGPPSWLRGQEPTRQLGGCGFDPWVGKTSWRRKWQSAPVFLPGKFQGQRSLMGYSPWGPKESDTTERLTLSLSWPAGSSSPTADPAHAPYSGHAES